MRRNPPIPWEVIREEFVTGPDDVTHQSLSVKYDVRREVVSRHSAKERWVAQRAQYRHQVATKTREKTSAHEAAYRAEQLRSAAVLRGLGYQAIERLRRPGKRIERDKDGKDIEVETPPPINAQMDAAEARRFVKEAAVIEHLALGVEAEVRLKLDGEVMEMLRRLRDVLSPDDYTKVLDVLALPPSGGETPS